MNDRSARPTPVVVLGSLNMDLVVFADRLPADGETVPGREFRRIPGGKGLNQVVAAARSGAHAMLVGAVGDDDSGEELLATLAEDHVESAHVRRLPGTHSGIALITIGSGGTNRIVVVPGANGRVTPDQLPELPGAVLLASLEVPVPVVTQAFVRAREVGMTTILNPAPAFPLPAELLDACDLLVPNEHEAAALTGEKVGDRVGAERAASALRARGARAVVVTLGDRGALVADADDCVLLPALPARPVDATAAGDAFCGALATRLAAGDRLNAAARFASAAGALAVEIEGAVPSLPRRDAIHQLLDATDPGP